MRIPKPKEIYQHFKKGNIYEVIIVAEDADTADCYVVYKQIPKNDDQDVDGRIWTRMVKSFMDEVEVDGKKIQRFKLVKKE
jgi:hypothetical protein